MKADILARDADQPLPRYTSYPTAPHFIAAVGAGTYRLWLEDVPPGSAASLYLHLPFCRSMNCAGCISVGVPPPKWICLAVIRPGSVSATRSISR